MPQINDFHEVRFPIDIALSASGGPHRRTEIVTLGSGHEQRNQRWAQSRRKFDAGYGIKGMNALHQIVAFFEARRGPLFGFRFRDPLDWKSCLPAEQPSYSDQELGIGDGMNQDFQLTKSYGSDPDAYVRTIVKPVDGSVVVGIDGVLVDDGLFDVDLKTGLVNFSQPPAAASVITSGFEFDVPVRFEMDELTVNLAAFTAGEIPTVPLVEVRI